MKLHSYLPVIFFIVATQDSTIAITSPASGDILRGEVTVTGSTDIPDFALAQLEFKYASDLSDTWFPLQTFSQPQADSPLFQWDTVSITDGAYILRLRVTLLDATFQEVTLPVFIQNDAPTPAPTPIPTSASQPGIESGVPTPFLLAASPTPTDTPRPTPTALPANPAALNQKDLYASLGRGALVIIGLFVFSGVILRLRRS